MYLEYVIKFPQAEQGALNAQNVRHVLSIALQSANIRLPLEIFGRDSDGLTRQVLYPSDEGLGRSYIAPPLVAISGFNSALRVIGHGPEGVALVEAHVAQMAGALSLALKSVYTISTYSGTSSLKPSGPCLYVIKSFLVEKNTKHLKPLLARCKVGDDGRHIVELDVLRPKIEAAIKNALIGQAMFLNEVMTDSSNLISVPSDEVLSIKAIEGTPFFTRIAERGWGIGVRDLVFSADVALSGRWSAGKFRSKGFGAIQPYNVAMRERAPAAQGATE